MSSVTITVTAGAPVAGGPETLNLSDLLDVTAVTGTGTTAVLNNTPTILTPTIASFANAAHDHLNAAGGANLSTAALTTGQLAVARGGSGVDASAAANGALLIGNGTGFSLAGLTQGANVTITPGAGTITIAATGGGGSDIGCQAERSSVQTIANNAMTALELNVENYDTSGFHDNSTNPSRFTIPVGQAGKYSFHASVPFAHHATGYRMVRMARNGNVATDVIGQDGRNAVTVTNPASFLTGINCYAEVNLAEGDYVEAYVYQTSGGNLDISFLSTDVPIVTLRKIDAAG